MAAGEIIPVSTPTCSNITSLLKTEIPHNVSVNGNFFRPSMKIAVSTSSPKWDLLESPV